MAGVQKTEQEWRTVLNKEQFRILREKGTDIMSDKDREFQLFNTYSKHERNELFTLFSVCAIDSLK